MAVVSEPVSTGQESAPAPSPAIIIGNPAPLGLYAFAITTFLLSMVNANLVSPAAGPVVYGVALMVGGVAQLLAGMWCYRTGNMMIHWGGYVGLVTAAGAAYVGLAEVLSEMYGRSILPLRPL